MYKDEQRLPESILQRQVTNGQEEPLHVTEENSVKNAIEIKEAKDNEEEENKEQVLMPRFDSVSISEDAWNKFTGKSIQPNEISKNRNQEENYLNGTIMKFRHVKK